MCGIDGVIRAIEVVVREGLPLATTRGHLGNNAVFGPIDADAFADGDDKTQAALLQVL
ncbi:hypothetical protein [Actibacterium sp. 188UL27-1]|uniref:hypothetical protein n=1 Tax=Actibacterium sp. 188UL27-1 TaxID=2786961 RepID=UPI00195CBA1B|nr:hypothetical protein [Actibacterium sp. 188UL27-1]MBM7066385.1 hypothetical protein [Actibacterium sp. 188UL27-1]